MNKDKLKIRECKKLRTSKFQHAMKKKLKHVITSIMRRAAVREEITTCLTEDGTGMATSVQEVAAAVIEFYKDWMKSKVSWRQRWKTWKDMINLNTDGLVDPRDKRFVETA